MQTLSSLSEQIHFKALEVATCYKRTEAELIEILQKVEDHRVFLKRGHSSLFDYVTRELGLAESTAYTMITLARKSREVPELGVEIAAGTITLSSARRIAPLLSPETPEANTEWIHKASVLTNRQLEKEIVKIRPKIATPERASYVTQDRVKLELGLSERELLRLRRVQDLLSQSRARAVSLEETLEALTAEYLSRHDPLEKAKRHQVKKGSSEAAPSEVAPENNPSESVGKQVLQRVAPKREPILAATLHQVNLRDQRRCTHRIKDGSRCNQARWIDIHHKIPVSEGGSNAADNLTTLCNAHHKLWHWQKAAEAATSPPAAA